MHTAPTASRQCTAAATGKPSSTNNNQGTPPPTPPTCERWCSSWRLAATTYAFTCSSRSCASACETEVTVNRAGARCSREDNRQNKGRDPQPCMCVPLNGRSQQPAPEQALGTAKQRQGAQPVLTCLSARIERYCSMAGCRLGWLTLPAGIQMRAGGARVRCTGERQHAPSQGGHGSNTLQAALPAPWPGQQQGANCKPGVPMFCANCSTESTMATFSRSTDLQGRRQGHACGSDGGLGPWPWNGVE